MAQCVEVWESDPEAYSYHPVGYMQISPEIMREDVSSIYEQQKTIDYPTEFVEGKKDSMDYMKGLFHDWQASGITSVLHEKKGGYANNTKPLMGLTRKAENEGVTITVNVKVTGFRSLGTTVDAVETDKGTVEMDCVVIGPGPWINTFWELLELPTHIDVFNCRTVHENIRMWRY